MSKRLLESDFLTVDLRSVFNSSNNTEPSAPETQENSNGTSSGVAKANWEEILQKQGFAHEIIEKLKTLGEPFRKALRILGFSTKLENKGNPILAFVKQPYVQSRLLLPGLLNISTFKAIYNAVAKNLVADSEFFEAREYNIIYCEDLYKKSPTEMEKYLELQSKILSPTARNYTPENQEKNRKIFLKISEDQIPEHDLKQRTIAINNIENKDKIIKSVAGATLNSLELANLINGKKAVEKVPLGTDEQSKLIKQVEGDPAKIFAALLSLSLSTGSESARNALSNDIFSRLSAPQVAEATEWLATNNAIPKGQLRDSDADTLVASLLAKVAERQQ